jgi:hypothetical protein
MEAQVGPISRKLITQIRGIKAQKVIELPAWSQAKKYAANAVQENQPSLQTVSEFGLYVYVNNWAISMVELLQDVPDLRKLMQKLFQAQEEYMPEGPPMSPLTKSFFYQWAIYDLPVGLKRETMGAILLAVGRYLKMDPEFLAVLQKLVDGRLGIYVNDGQNAETVTLKELFTGQSQQAVSSSGYLGKRGELWLTRVMPPPTDGFSRSVVVTTPYVILNPGVDGWTEYFNRTFPKTQRKEPIFAYQYLMKFGLQPDYWPEYGLSMSSRATSTIVQT